MVRARRAAGSSSTKGGTGRCGRIDAAAAGRGTHETMIGSPLTVGAGRAEYRVSSWQAKERPMALHRSIGGLTTIAPGITQYWELSLIHISEPTRRTPI